LKNVKGHLWVAFHISGPNSVRISEPSAVLMPTLTDVIIHRLTRPSRGPGTRAARPGVRDSEHPPPSGPSHR